MEADMEEKKVSRLHSVKIKVIAAVFLAVLAAISICLLILIPMFKEKLSDSVENNMMNLAKAYGSMLDMELSEEEGESLSQELLKEILQGIRVEGVASSYAYLVSSDSTMLYHPTASKIGSSVENTVVMGLTEQIRRGMIPEDSVKRYEFNGVIKFASWHISPIDHSILVVTADEEDIFSELAVIYERSAIAAAIVAVLMAILAYFIGMGIARPIKKLTLQISAISNFDFREKKEYARLLKRRDETGVMSSAVEQMRSNVWNMLKDIQKISDALNGNASELEQIAAEVNANSGDNSATSEELAAGMQETSATAETINIKLNQIEEQTDNVSQLTVDGEKLAELLMDRAKKLQSTTEQAGTNTKKMYEEVKKKTSQAITQSKAVSNISQLADAIKEIASQTGLLSLNASIEAARAGDSGRGFAVVASEIGSLATQSTEAVDRITIIVTEVRTAVENMAQCLETSLGFLENTVLQDYADFTDAGKQYHKDAVSVDSSMQTIRSSMKALDDTIREINQSIAGINTTIAEAATGVTDIAEKTSDTVGLTARTSQMAEENVTHSVHLKEIVDQFQL